MRRFIGFILIAASLAGCAPIDRDKLAKEVVAKDPEFGAVLEKRKELASRIETYNRELAVRKSEVEKKIAQLRRDLVESSASVRSRSSEVKKRMEPDRARIQQLLVQAGNDVRMKREQRSSLAKQIALAKKSGSAIPPEMTQQTERLDQDLKVLMEEVRLLKIKLLLIKL